MKFTVAGKEKIRHAEISLTLEDVNGKSYFNTLRKDSINSSANKDILFDFHISDSDSLGTPKTMDLSVYMEPAATSSSGTVKTKIVSMQIWNTERESKLTKIKNRITGV